MNREAQWLKKAKRGDYTWFDELVDAYKNRVYAMAWRFTLNANDADDLAQEIFMLIYRKIGTFRGESGLSTWIYRVAYNRSIRRKPSVVTLPLSLEAYDPPACYDLSRQIDVHDAISKLPAIYRAVIELHYFQGLSVEEIARIQNAPKRTVETRMYRARERLRRILSPYEKEAKADG